MSYPKLPQAKDKGMGAGRREQLRTILSNKFKTKFEAYRAPAIGKIIDREVDKYISSEKLTEANLKALDAKIQSYIQSKFPNDEYRPDSKASMISGVSKTSKSSALTTDKQEERLGTGLTTSTTKQSKVSGKGRKKSDDWGQVVEFNRKKFEVEEEENRRLEAQRKANLKNALDMQIREKEGNCKIDQKLLNTYEIEFFKNLDHMNEEEKKKHIAHMEKVKREKRMIEEQKSAEERRRAQRKTDDKKEAIKYVEEATKALQVEEDMKVQKRVQAKVTMKETLKDIEEVKKHQEKKRNEEHINDIKVQEEMSKQFDKQEREKKDAKERKEERINARMAFAMEGAYKIELEKLAADERRIKNNALEVENREAKADARKFNKKKADREEMKKVLEKQIIHKNYIYEDERKENEVIAEQWKREITDYYSVEKKKEADKREENMKHRRVLEEQIEEKRKMNEHRMHPKDFEMNKRLIHEINMKAKNQAIRPSPGADKKNRHDDSDEY